MSSAWYAGLVHEFEAEIKIIGANPYVTLPLEVLAGVFEVAGRDKGPIPIRGAINKRCFQQTLVRYAGAWRLYVNLQMLDDSPRRIGESVAVEIEFDPSDRTIEPHPKLVEALASNERARQVFENLAPSRRNEIVRYIARLKTDESVSRNVARAIDFLLGKGRFVGRDKP